MNEIGADLSHRDLVVIGTSAGGVDTLPRLLGQLPGDFAAAVLVVQHLTPMSSMHLVDIVRRATALPVSWGEHGNRIRTGEIVIAPPGIHMVVERAQVVLAGGPRESHARPSIDVLFRSAAAHHAGRVIGVLLTGMLDDGVAGLGAIHEVGGIVVVQDPDDATFGDMPRAALAQVAVDHIAPIEAMGPLLAQLAREAPREAPVPEELALVAAHESGEVIAMHAANDDGADDQETERSLWAAVRSLQQQASTLAKLARESRMVGSAAAAEYEKRSVEAYDDANRARRFLLERQQRRHHRRSVTAARREEAHPAARARRRGRRA